MTCGSIKSVLQTVECATAAILAVVAVISASGCQSVTYRPGDLPVEYAAPERTGAADMDLSQFARPAANSDVVQAGDVVEVSIATGLEQRYVPKWQLRVDDNGDVNVPLIGPVRLAGLALDQADYVVYRAAVDRGYYRNPNVSVVRVARRHNRVTVAGAVKKPGAYELPAGQSDVLAAIVAAGGLDEDAGTIVEIRQPQAGANSERGGQTAQLTAYRNRPNTPEPAAQAVQFDLAAAQHVDELDVLIGDGAVVTVRERPTQAVYVMGKVKKPGQVELPNGMDLHLLDAIALAGGRTIEIADRVYIVRTLSEGSEPVLIQASISAAKSDPVSNLRLAPGDVVSVEETAATYAAETLQKMLRFGFSSRILF